MKSGATDAGTWTIHAVSGGLGPFATEWDALRRRLFRANSMLDSRYIDALLANFGQGQEALAVWRRTGQIEGMCVLIRKSPLIWASFLPPQAQVGPTLLKDATALPLLLRSLPGPVMELDLLCNDTESGAWTQTAFADIQTIDHCLTMHINLTGSFEDYWGSRSKKLVQNRNRYRRRAEAEHVQQELVTLTGAADMPAAVARYAALEQAGWKGQLGTAIGSSPQQSSFYEKLMTQLASQGQAIVWELWFNNELVASRLAVREDDTVTMLKTTYREYAAAFSPGLELLRCAIEQCFAIAPGGRIEFYTDATEDQLRWASGSRWIRHVAFYRFPLARMLATGVRFGRRHLDNLGQPTDERDFRVEVYKHPSQFPPPVLDLFAATERSDMQFGTDWYRNLIDQVYSQHAGVRFYVLCRRERAVAALPVLAERGPLGWKIQALSNYYTALFEPNSAPGVKDRHLSVLIRALKRDHPGLVSIKFYPMATEAPSFGTLKSAMNRANLACFSYFGFGNWFMRVNEDWSTYLRGRDGRQRSTITRMGKKFAAENGRLEIISDTADVERGIRAYEAVYAASWKKPEPFKGFVPGLMRFCAARGWLRLGIAWLGDHPVAAQLWICANGKADIYKLAYDEAYKAYSPGTLLTALLMQQAMDVDKVREIDYLIGDDPYKESWMSARRERWGLVAYNPFSWGGALCLIKELLGRTARALKPNALAAAGSTAKAK